MTKRLNKGLEKSKKTLALDCATRTGWAVIEAGKVVDSGMKDFRRMKADVRGDQFRRFREWLEEKVTRYRPSKIRYEQAHHRGRAATEFCIGYTTRAEEVAATAGIGIEAVHTSKIKMFATGKGNAGKMEMHDAAWKVLGRVPVDDNEADAVMLGLMRVK